MKKLVVITLIGALLVPTLYAAKPMKLQDKTSMELLMTIEDLAHDLSEADREALYHNLKAKFKGKLGGSRYENSPLACLLYTSPSPRDS